MGKLVYLLEAATGAIKIGCANDPWRRCYTIVTAAPCPVTLIAQWPGTHADEFDLHRQFLPFRIYREWYRCEGAFADFVNQRRGLNMDAADVPPWAQSATLTAPERKQHLTERLARMRLLKLQVAA